jgi:hypothetical protein
MAKDKLTALQQKVEKAKEALDAERGKEFVKVMKPYLLFLNPAAVKKTVPKLSAKAQAVLDTIIKEDFGCNRKKVINLMSVVLGEKLPIPTNDDSSNRPSDGQVIVVLKEVDSHNYTVGQPYMVAYADDYYLMDANGKVGNQGPTDYGEEQGYWRFATPTEVKAFVSKMNVKALRIMNYSLNMEEATKENYDPDEMNYTFEEELEGLQLVAKKV